MKQWSPPKSYQTELSGELVVLWETVFRLVLLLEFSTFRDILGVWHFDFIESGNGFY